MASVTRFTRRCTRLIALLLLAWALPACNLLQTAPPEGTPEAAADADTVSSAAAGAPEIALLLPQPEARYRIGADVVVLADLAGANAARVEIHVDERLLAAFTRPSGSVSAVWTGEIGAHTARVTAYSVDDAVVAEAAAAFRVVTADDQPVPTTAPQIAIPPTETGVTATAERGVIVRRGPNTGFNPPAGTLGAGQTVSVTGISPDGDWLRIQYRQMSGWVLRAFVTLSGDPARLPVDAGPPTPTPFIAPDQTPDRRANLVAGSLSLRPLPARCNEPFTLSLDITNDGRGDSLQTAVRVVDRRAEDDSIQADFIVNLPPIEPGQVIRVDIPTTISTWYNEEHILTVIIDPDDGVREVSEDDNGGQIRYMLDKAACP
jgi:hypothetical protein